MVSKMKNGEVILIKPLQYENQTCIKITYYSFDRFTIIEWIIKHDMNSRHYLMMNMSKVWVL